MLGQMAGERYLKWGVGEGDDICYWGGSYLETKVKASKREWSFDGELMRRHVVLNRLRFTLKYRLEGKDFTRGGEEVG